VLRKQAQEDEETALRGDHPCDHVGVTFTVESLIQDPLIGTRLVAGSSGRDREVAWAHTCEVKDPWNWLGSGDLLMTDGYSFPAHPDGQTHFVRQLALANISGLALGEGFVAPPLTRAAMAIADQLGFPVLQTARSVPFVTIARVVAEAVGGQGNPRASRVLRLYEILRRSQSRGSTDTLLDQFAIELKADLHVLELKRGRELLPTSSALPESLRQSVLTCVEEHKGQLPAFNRLPDDLVSALLVPVGTRDAAALLVRARSSTDAPNLMLAQHAATIAEFEVEQRAARGARQRSRAAELVRNMLEGTIAPDAAARQLQLHGLGDGPWTITAWHEPSPQSALTDLSTSPLGDVLAFVSWPHLHSFLEDTHVVVVRHDQYENGLDLEPLEASVGVSQPLSSVARFADAVREARWALESARKTGASTAVYGSHGSYFMPHTVAEGEIAVRRLLGAVIDYDRANDAQLMKSLLVYFEVNRSWQAGARQLGIHKQTLVYRMKKIEELTGASLRDFGVQAELYLALRTWRLLSSD
jgi:purine catabolism regulator